jgi:PKD repeat protein
MRTGTVVLVGMLLVAWRAPSMNPIASFTGNPVSGPPTLTVNVDATASVDPDGTIAAYDWDWGDTTTGSGATTSHGYAATGTYRITLTVTDNSGDTATKTLDVDCISASNLPPVHSAGAFPVLGTAPMTVLIDSMCHDDFGNHSEVWDFADGSPTEAFPVVANHAGTSVLHIFALPGVYTVNNRTTDPEGIWRDVGVTFTVVAPPSGGGGGGGGGCGLTGLEVPLLLGLLLLYRRFH